MALLFLDGFEEYDGNNLTTLWNDLSTSQAVNGVAYTHYSSGMSLNTSNTRTAQNGITSKSLSTYYSGGGVLGISLPTGNPFVVGFGFYPTVFNNHLCGFTINVNHSYVSNAGTGIRIILKQDGTIAAINNSSGATVAASTTTVTLNAWYYIEIRYVFGSTAGELQIKINGTDYINVTGVNTAGGASLVNSFYFQASAGDNLIDDLYICDTTGSTNNSFLGPISVYTLVPTSNSTIVDMTASAGSNYACVDEIPANSTDYVTGTTSGHMDLYGMSDLPAAVSSSATSPGVLLKARATKPTANNGQIQLAAKTNATTATSGNKPLTQTSYVSVLNVFENQPDGSAWAKAALDALEAGIKVI